MKPDSTALVTVNVNGKNFDMELPLFINIAELNLKLKETLEGLGVSVGDFSVLTDGGVPIDNFCLAHFGVWDGSIINVV